MLPLLRRAWLKRLAPGTPVGGLLLTADVALLAGRHVNRLDGAQRRRLVALARQARGRPGSLDEAERQELMALLAALEPRLFVGSALRRLSPLPLPKRLLYGARGSSARRAAAARRP
jgi:hypothetical protein